MNQKNLGKNNKNTISRSKVLSLEEMKSIESVRLSNQHTVGMYLNYVLKKDIKSITEIIENRFLERFIRPIQTPNMHGFTVMAVCCLMIESLQSFREGDISAKNVGKMFEDFLKDDSFFGFSENLSKSFYRDIRCGILHQVETRGGWKIRRQGIKVIDESTKIIDAVMFSKTLISYFENYCGELKQCEWGGILAENAVKKMDDIVRKCIITPIAITEN